MVNQLAPEHRKTAFNELDTLLQNIHQESDPWERFIRTAHLPLLPLNREQDMDWVLAMLADTTLPNDKRELMLEIAIRLPTRTEDCATFQKRLTPMVSDLPHLLARLNPPAEPADPAMTTQPSRLDQIAAQHRQGEQNKRDGWLRFYQELIDNPAAAFAKDRAEDTAWNLWQAMRKAEEQNAEYGWNRAFIEQHFGQSFADQLRTTLMTMWRQEDLLISDPKIGLTAITAEAEQDDWATSLTTEEAQLATRYALLAPNCWPSWLESLAKSHLSHIAPLFEAELAETTTPSAYIWLIPMLRTAPRVLITQLLPTLASWLDAQFHAASEQASGATLAQVAELLLRHGNDAQRADLCTLAHTQALPSSPLNKISLPLLLNLDAAAGIAALERLLKPIPVAQDSTATHWFGFLFGHGPTWLQPELTPTNFTPEQLLRLLRLAYKHIRLEDDLRRGGGVYSPNQRDGAEEARSALFNALMSYPGEDAWQAKMALCDDPLFVQHKDRIYALAGEQAAADADSSIYSEQEYAKLAQNHELPPKTGDAMFALLRDRLDDLDDLLLRDASPRDGLAATTEETSMRRQLAYVLGSMTRSAYLITQEEVTADEKRTDIRLRSTGSDQQAVIELKIAEKKWTIAALKKALSEQLVSKYMASENSRSGCLLITRVSKEYWIDPKSKKHLSFDRLIELLNEEAQSIQQQLGQQLRLTVKGLDLRPRLATEAKRDKAP
ncbi:hypothetical protein HZU77_005935 [Neisseriaceae bacterium TC5R-5]|nr:hypothetical protein [Neisseriaceae bacterium TC5R-5]